MMPSACNEFRTDLAREKQIAQFLPLVRYCVSGMHLRNAPLGLEYEDLIGHGTLGLIQAVDRFDESQGVKFSNFAITRIRGAVLDAMRALDPIGRSTRHASRTISEEFNTLALELGRNPTPPEVQESSGLTEHRYWRARNAAGMRVVSIDAPMDDGSSLADRLDDGTPDFVSVLEKHELSRALANAVGRLPERDKLVLSLYYLDGLTLKDVARVMAISETRVSQLLGRAHARLRVDPALKNAA
jgi:RNA polymerase sigma factor for flagellar operon FliA